MIIPQRLLTGKRRNKLLYIVDGIKIKENTPFKERYFAEESWGLLNEGINFKEEKLKHYTPQSDILNKFYNAKL